MNMVLVAAVSADGFIADGQGMGDFSSPEDKAQLRAYLKGESLDGFVCGRKTAEEFGARLSHKPLYVLTHERRADAGNVKYFRDRYELIRKAADGLPRPRLALLGGAGAYEYFLSERAVDEARITIERGTEFGGGLPLGFKRYEREFTLAGAKKLGPSTDLLIYYRRSKGM